MKAFSHTFFARSAVEILRDLKAFSVVLGFGITICLTGIASAEAVRYSWTGTIITVDVDSGTGTFAGTQVDDTFSGTFTYDPDVANIEELYTSDGDSIIEPGDLWVEYVLGSGSSTLTNGNGNVSSPGAGLSITTNYPLNDPEGVAFASALLGKQVPMGTLVDQWGLDFSVDDRMEFSLSYVSIVDIQDDLAFRPFPPWAPPGSPPDPDNQIVFFEIYEFAEPQQETELFAAVGVVTIAEVQQSTLGANQTFSDGGTPVIGDGQSCVSCLANGWTFNSGGIALDAGEEGPGDHAISYDSGGFGFHLLTWEGYATADINFLGDYAEAGVVGVRFRARHSGIGDSVVLRAVLFDSIDDEFHEQWAISDGSATIVNTGTGTTWRNYTISLRESDMESGAFEGTPPTVAEILSGVAQFGLRHDPNFTGPGVPAHLSAAVYFDDIELILDSDFQGMVSLVDISGNGIPEIGVAVPGSTRLHIRDGSTDALISDIDFGADEAIDIAVLPDLDMSGGPEVAVLGQQASGQGRVQIKDSLTGNGPTVGVGNLWYGMQYDPVSMAVVPHYGSGAGPEIAVLGAEPDTDAVRVQLRDSSSNDFVDNVFLGTQSTAHDLVSLTDVSGNNIPEMGILGVINANDQVRMQIWDADTAAFQNNVWFAKVYQPQSTITMPDINSNGSDEIVAVGVDPATDNIRLQVRDSLSLATHYNIWLGNVNTAVDVAMINDINADGFPDIAILLERPDGTGRVRVQSGDDGAFIRNLFYTVVENPVGLAVMPDYSGNGFDELAVLGENAGTRHVQILDTSTGTQVNRIDFP